MRIIGYLLVVLWVFAPLRLVAQPSPTTCVDVGSGQRPNFEGRLSHHIFPGPPGYEDVRRGDRPEPAYILTLHRSTCVRSEGDEFLDSIVTDRIHLIAIDAPQVEAALRRLIGRSVLITGTDGYGGHTGHHRAPLVLSVVSVSPAIDGSTDPLAQTTVEAFYRALEVGNGQSASEMIVPWKRSGAFSSNALSRYYGRLSEPLKLIEVLPLGRDSFEVRYTFVDRNRRCDGRARVATTTVGGLNLIESIRSLSGC